MSTIPSNLPFTFKKASVRDLLVINKKASHYQKIIDKFVESKQELALLDIVFPDSVVMGDIMSFALGIRSAIKRMNVDILVILRRGDIYLAHPTKKILGVLARSPQKPDRVIP